MINGRNNFIGGMCAALVTLVLLQACHSLETIEIDYLKPAQVSFPQELRKVGVVNNVPGRYGAHAAESLAQAVADENYFDEVVICDSALHAPTDTVVRALHPQEATLLSEQLDVDLLMVIDDVKLYAKPENVFIPGWQAWQQTLDLTVQPHVSVWLPKRKNPIVRVEAADSIYWEGFGGNAQEALAQLPSDTTILREAYQFAGSIPLPYLLPTWQTSPRHYFDGISANFRDAAIWAREDDWAQAARIWTKEYQTNKGKKQCYAAFNAALAYEMQDSLDTAVEWCGKAHRIAQSMEKNPQHAPLSSLTLHYLALLQQRASGATQLKAQMQRFEEE